MRFKHGLLDWDILYQYIYINNATFNTQKIAFWREKMAFSSRKTGKKKA